MENRDINVLPPRESARLIAKNSKDVVIHPEGVDKIANHVCICLYTTNSKTWL